MCGQDPVIGGGVGVERVGAWALAPTFRIWLPLGWEQDTHFVFFLHSNKMTLEQLSRHGWMLTEQSDRRYWQDLCSRDLWA